MNNEKITYTPKELQALLGISRTAVYKLINDPPFPVLRIGKAIRIPKEGVESWLIGR